VSAPINDAVEALRDLGGWASASALCDKLVCPHCGHSMDRLAAQLLIQRSCDAGLIAVERDFTLSLSEGEQ